MTNMGYVRFENTLIDLEECYDFLSCTDGDLQKLSASEKEYAKRMIDLCGDIYRGFGEGY